MFVLRLFRNVLRVVIAGLKRRRRERNLDARFNVPALFQCAEHYHTKQNNH